MSQILKHLQDLDRATYDIAEQYVQTVSDSKRQSLEIQMKQLTSRLESLQPEVVRFLAGDASAAQTAEVSELYVELQQRAEEFENQKLEPRPVNPRALQPALAQPNQDELDENVKDLRLQLQNMNAAVQTTVDQNTSSLAEQESKRSLRDASMYAVQQAKQGAFVQQEQLSAELQATRQQLDQTSDENHQLRIENARLQAELSELQRANCTNHLFSERLFEERQTAKEDFELLISDRERARAKLENVKRMYEHEVQRNSAQKREHFQKISELETENKQLENENVQLTERIRLMQRCDVESAAIEVKRASQTIQKLTQQVEELKEKLRQQKTQESETLYLLKHSLATTTNSQITNSAVEEPSRTIKKYQAQTQALSRTMGSSAKPYVSSIQALNGLKLMEGVSQDWEEKDEVLQMLKRK